MESKGRTSSKDDEHRFIRGKFFFWDAHRVIFINYLEEEKAIKGEYSTKLLLRLIERPCNG